MQRGIRVTIDGTFECAWPFLLHFLQYLCDKKYKRKDVSCKRQSLKKDERIYIEANINIF